MSLHEINDFHVYFVESITTSAKVVIQKNYPYTKPYWFYEVKEVYDQERRWMGDWVRDLYNNTKIFNSSYSRPLSGKKAIPTVLCGCELWKLRFHISSFMLCLNIRVIKDIQVLKFFSQIRYVWKHDWHSSNYVAIANWRESFFLCFL